MKTKILMVALLTSSLYAADASMSWVDQKIEEIKPQRHGVSSATIKSLKNPFIYIKPETKKGKGNGSTAVKKATGDKVEKKTVKRDLSGAPLTLQVVLNSSALINGKWYKENSKVRGYTLTNIQNNSVVLVSKKKTIKLFIAQKNKNLNISTK